MTILFNIEGLREMKADWDEVELENACGIYDNLRKPVNSKERKARIKGKNESELYPYYGATGQVGLIDDYLTDGEFVLIGEDGAPFLEFKKDVAYLIKGKTWVNNHAHILLSHFNNKFLLFYLNQINFNGYVSGTTRLKLTQSSLRKIPVKIAPLPEQRAIVAKIEQLFSELDHGIANLKAAREKLEIYRQAVLKKAFEGELTREWREQQTDLPTAEMLLEQIKTERQRHYDQQIADWQAAVQAWEQDGSVGKKPRNPKTQKKIANPDQETTEDLAEIPQNWIYNYLAHAGELGRGISKHRPRNAKKLFGGIYPFIQTAEVKAQEIITEYSQTYNDIGLAQSKLWPKGTLCITIAANIAETGFLGIDACFPDSIVGFVPFDSIIKSKYIEYFLRSTKRKINAWAPATAQKNINLATLENLIIPYCSLAEQTQIVHQIETRLSVCDKLAESIDQSLAQAEALRQSILKKAFAGELLNPAERAACRQEPDWEPAEQLLARIQNESKSKGNK